MEREALLSKAASLSIRGRLEGHGIDWEFHGVATRRDTRKKLPGHVTRHRLPKLLRLEHSGRLDSSGHLSSPERSILTKNLAGLLLLLVPHERASLCPHSMPGGHPDSDADPASFSRPLTNTRAASHYEQIAIVIVTARTDGPLGSGLSQAT